VHNKKAKEVVITILGIHQFLLSNIQPTEKISIAARAEYYRPKSIIIVPGTPNGFQTYGYSLNLDFTIAENVLWRIEGRGFSSKDQIFTMKTDKRAMNNYFVTTALAFHFKMSDKDKTVQHFLDLIKKSRKENLKSTSV
jgi:hypothetical protein